mmetsp:Transcript_17908/g.33953  ORF Transcript_17908/g.33953 Transcript_17908/m.33953 type:complete len:225 (-) Transcript_17908:340-1014(-)
MSFASESSRKGTFFSDPVYIHSPKIACKIPNFCTESMERSFSLTRESTVCRFLSRDFNSFLILSLSSRCLFSSSSSSRFRFSRSFFAPISLCCCSRMAGSNRKSNFCRPWIRALIVILGLGPMISTDFGISASLVISPKRSPERMCSHRVARLYKAINISCAVTVVSNVAFPISISILRSGVPVGIGQDSPTCHFKNDFSFCSWYSNPPIVPGSLIIRRGLAGL